MNNTVTQHTPGPWATGKTPEGKCYVDCGGLPVICVEQYYNGHEANAKLIAAAPDLLRALEDLRRELWAAGLKLNVRKHASLLIADAAAGTALLKATTT